jgi:hypothetical protein
VLRLLAWVFSRVADFGRRGGGQTLDPPVVPVRLCALSLRTGANHFRQPHQSTYTVSTPYFRRILHPGTIRGLFFSRLAASSFCIAAVACLKAIWHVSKSSFPSIFTLSALPTLLWPTPLFHRKAFSRFFTPFPPRRRPRFFGQHGEEKS